ncbi:MAG: transketolase, partial [Verrucomicrobia bacterium]|nr:transketolase [Verrucomicrobiota bacterium]
NLGDLLPGLEDQKAMATRKSLNIVLTKLFEHIPHIVGGSADLAGSNGTFVKGYDSVSADSLTGRNMHFGIREHGMSAIMNGMALHGGWTPYGGTFLVFSDYSRPSIRMAALMGLRVIFVFSHDSVLLGEDGPTHQPIEHLQALRLIPNLTVIRPADQTETAPAWIAALGNATGPTALIVTRQTLPVIDRKECAPAAETLKGGYVLWQAQEGAPDIIFIGSGSEVHICLQAARELSGEGVNARVVSMPSTELFELQSEEYRRAVLPDDCQKRITIEAAVSDGLARYCGMGGLALGINRFGASAPYDILAEKFGLTAKAIVSKARELLQAS